MGYQRVFSSIMTPFRRRAVLRLGAVSLAVLLALSWLNVVPALAQSVTLSSTSGPPGTSVTVSGSGFVNGDTYQITFALSTIYAQVLAPTTVISGTSFSRTVTIPSAPLDYYTISVTTSRGGVSPSFQVTPIMELTATTGFIGDTVSVNGRGFRANGNVSVIFNNSTVASTTSDTYGNLNAVDFTVPARPVGDYDVYTADVIASSPKIVFTIMPHLIIIPSEGAVGSELQLEGTGFGPNYGINIYWDSHIVTSNVITNSSGSFTTTLTVPATTRGIHQIAARDSGLNTGTASFAVRPAISVSPSTGSPGTIVTVTGSGFRSSATVQITFNGATVATRPAKITTGSSGGFLASFTVPSIVAGSYAVIASDGLYSATVTFGIAANVIISPTSGHVGSEIIVSGTGFTPGGHVALSYDSQSLLTVTADGAGAFSLSFNAPVSQAGPHTISALDLNNQSVAASATFTMESIPPPVPSLLTPQYGSQADTLPDFSWSPVTDSSGVTYNLQVARDAAFSQLVLFKQGLTQPQYQVADSERLALTKKDSPFYWRVQAVDGASNASNWAVGSFYTQDSTPPSLPVLSSPVNASQAVLQPDFTWSAVSDPSGVTYNLQVALEAAFSRLVLYKQDLTQPQYQVPQAESLQLTKKTAPYYWRVQAVDGAGNASDWTAAGSFYTQDSTPPPAPAPLSPANGSRTGPAVSFDWTDVSDPSGVTYDLEVAQDAGFSHLVVYKEGLDTSEYKLTAAEELAASTGKPPTAYYWRVNATDGAKNISDWSVVDTFYVNAFRLQGWLLAVVLVIGGALVLAAGIFIGMKIRPAQSSDNIEKGGNTG